jgi:biotin transport system substrate-specific component
MNSGPTSAVASAPARPLSRPLAARLAAALAGALLVALSAQVAVPLWGTPVPMTLQPLAVLIVGGLLGPRLGALSLLLYLAMGATGLPVFTPFGPPGMARLLGPTGGYLLAYPAAAALAGLLAGLKPGAAGAALGALAGMLAIHLGGLAQLMALTGSVESAFAAGTLPFLAGDLAKLALASLVIAKARPHTRALH